MNKSHTSILTLLLCSTTLLVSCGGGGGGVVEQTEEISATATDGVTDAATNLASEATDAISENWQDIEIDWDNQISSVQDAFPDLSVDEITGTAGKPENMVSLIEQKYGISREEAQAKVSEWASSL